MRTSTESVHPRRSGTSGTGQLVVTSTGSINPVNLGAGDLTTLTGQGFVPGETVTVSFSGGSPTLLVAGPTGSVSATLASPAEPYPGGTISVDDIQSTKSGSAAITATSPGESQASGAATLTRSVS